MKTHRVGSYVLLAAGVLLVFAGLTAALGFSTSGAIASVAAIAALLYAGAVWFGAAAADTSVLVFTPQLIVAVGPLSGRPVLDLFPPADRKAIDLQCRAAIDGRSNRFSAGGQTFDAAPVRGVDGAVVYGILLADAAIREPAAAR